MSIAKLDAVEFSKLITRAAQTLQSVCPSGEPNEDQVRQVVRSVKLPLSHENESFILDPIRMAVMVNAYNPGGANHMADTTYRAWQYYFGLPAEAA